MGKLKTLNINQTSTELVSVDDIDRLALLISNNELNSTAVLFIEELIESKEYIDLRDLMDDEHTITFKGCLNTPTNIAYKDALDVLLAHGVTNECADTYIRVYTLLLEILKNADGATDGKGISLTIADTLTILDLSGTELKEFQSIHDAYNALTRINLAYTDVEGDIDVDKYTNLETINTKGSGIDNIDGLTNKASLKIVNYNTPNKIEIAGDDLLSLADFSGKVISSKEINDIATYIIENKGEVTFNCDEEELTVSDSLNVNWINVNVLLCASEKKLSIDGIDKPRYYDYQVTLGLTEETTEKWIIDFVNETNISCQLLIDRYAEHPEISKIGYSYLTYDGNSYFDLGEKCDINTEVRFLFTDSGTSTTVNRSLFGSRKDVSTSADNFSIYINASSRTVRILYTNIESTFTNVINRKRKIVFNRYEALFDDKIFTNTSESYSDGNVNCLLGARQNSSGFIEDSKHIGRIYTLYWYEGKELTHCYVPISNDTLLDLITNTTLSNLGTGTATYGYEETWREIAESYGLTEEFIEEKYNKYGIAILKGLENNSYMTYNGNSYYRLNLTTTINTTWILNAFTTLSTSNTQYLVLIGRGDSVGSSGSMGININNNQLRVFRGNLYGNLTTTSVSLNTIYTYYIDSSKAMINSNVYTFSNPTITNGKYYILLGSWGSSTSNDDLVLDSATFRWKGGIFSLFWKESDLIAHLFIPLEKNKILDLITDTIIINAGTEISKYFEY